MKYDNVTPAVFESRPNRFIANVDIGGEKTAVHVKNTGRCKELLVPGCRVYLEKSVNPARKTAYDLIATEKEGILINMDSMAPNKVFEEWIRQKYPFLSIRREVKYKDSRFDFLLSGKSGETFVEVKGVTLEESGGTYFPDAPTERGVKHLYGLADAVKNGYGAAVFFVIQMKKADFLSPNDKTHPRFGDALRYACKNGVKAAAYSCLVSPDSLSVDRPVKIIL